MSIISALFKRYQMTFVVGILLFSTFSLLAKPIDTVQGTVQSRTGKTIRWEQDQAAMAQTEQDVRNLLRKPLTINAAVQIALLNNRSLQATFEEIGLSAAELRNAGTIPNPSFNLSIRFPDKAPSGTDLEYGAAIDFLRLLMLPLRKRVAKEQLEATTLRVADETLELVAQVKSAFYSVQASQQLLERLKLISEASSVALELAQRQHEAGNITDLALAQQLTAYSRSRIEVAQTETEIRQQREKLNRLLGLWGNKTNWELTGSLPDVPESDLSVNGLERLAISQRLDLQAQYLGVTSLVRALGLTKSFRFIGALNFGVDSERGSDSRTITGPTFVLELPIFNQRQAAINRSEVALRQQQRKFEALAIDVRSRVRELRDQLSSQRELARFYRDELLPNQRRILSQTLLNYNAMQVSPLELFTAKAEEAQIEREYMGAVRDYWITRTELERAVGGSLRPLATGASKKIAAPQSSRTPVRSVSNP